METITEVTTSETFGAIATISTLFPSSKLVSFTQFPDLPFELRHKIWDHAIEQIDARIVELGLDV